jgi:methionine biosynthesis protein MetW
MLSRLIAELRELTRPAPLQDFDSYDDYWRQRETGHRLSASLPRYPRVSAMIPQGHRVLDFGCGHGEFLQYLKQHRPDLRVTAADISSHAIEALRKAGIDAVLLDPNAPVDAGLSPAFDTILALAVIEHIADCEKTGRDLMRLVPKQLIFTIPNVGFITNRFRLLLGRFPITLVFYHMKEHIRFWTATDFKQWAQYMQLRVVEIQPENPRLLSRVSPSLFSRALIFRCELLKPSHQS